MQEKTYYELLKDYGLSDSIIQGIKSGDIGWDFYDDTLFISNNEGGTHPIRRLSEIEISNVMNAYRFEKREKSSASDSEIFFPGELGDWAGVGIDSNWREYVDAYLQSASVLASHIPNHFIDPYLFMCRHSLELLLKSIVMLGQRYLDLDADLPDHHDLQRLGIAAYPYIELLGKMEKTTISNISKTVNEFHKIDPMSFNFRYPVSKKNQRIKHESYLQSFHLSKHNEAFQKIGLELKKLIENIEMRTMFKNAMNRELSLTQR